jgi:hypothetical protein
MQRTRLKQVELIRFGAIAKHHWHRRLLAQALVVLVVVTKIEKGK